MCFFSIRYDLHSTALDSVNRIISITAHELIGTLPLEEVIVDITNKFFIILIIIIRLVVPML